MGQTVYGGQTALIFITGYGLTSQWKGWRDIQLGAPSSVPEFDRCQNMEHGNVKNLPHTLPYPPSSPPWDGVTDRFQVSCVQQERTCDQAHRANNRFCSDPGDVYSIKIDYFMDCKA